MYIYGRNSVKEAYLAGKTVDKLFLVKDDRDPALNKVRWLARDARTAISFCDRATLDKLADGGNHQGVVAAVTDFQYASLDDIISSAREKEER